MTIGGWISMTITLGLVLGFFSWCCYKLVTAPETKEEELADALEELEARNSAPRD